MNPIERIARQILPEIRREYPGMSEKRLWEIAVSEAVWLVDPADMDGDQEE